MKYTYQARDFEGRQIKGTIEAANRDEVLDALSAKNLYPTYLEEKSAKGTFQGEINFSFFNRISQKDIVMFSRQLAIMIDANVPPAEALDALASQTNNQKMKTRLAKVAADVRGGTLLSRAFAKYPEIFSTFYVNMVKSAEVSGDLPKVLERVADHLESEYYIRSKTMGALTYPIVIFVVFIAIFIVIMVYVIPGLIDVISSTGQSLPWTTQVIIAISNFLRNQWYIIMAVVAGLVAFLIYYPRTKEGKDVIDSFILKIPIFGNFLRNTYIMRFAENLSTLISAGIPIADALEIVADLVGNNVYRRLILDVRKKVVKGEGIYLAFSVYEKEFTPLFVQMASVGEKTGQLEISLLNVVRFYKRETETFVESLSSIIEPVMIIFLAIMVGFLVASVLLPVYQISTTLPTT